MGTAFLVVWRVTSHDLADGMNVFDCRSCGACCKDFVVDVHSTDEEVPEHMVKDDRLFGMVMRTRNRQCIALKGKIGCSVRCSIYEHRPTVCQEFRPGSEQCLHARERLGIAMTPNTNQAG